MWDAMHSNGDHLDLSSEHDCDFQFWSVRVSPSRLKIWGREGTSVHLGIAFVRAFELSFTVRSFL